MQNKLWNSRISNPSGKKLMDLFAGNEFEISAPQCLADYSPACNGDVLDIVTIHVVRKRTIPT
jgi:hypothetical protein